MCELCSSDPATKKLAYEGVERLSNRLYQLSNFYQRVAAGRVKPHTPEWKEQHSDMRAVVKEFLEILL